MSNPNERWNIMGYYQNLQVELEDIQDEELREIVAWDHAHRHLLSAEERYNILTNEVLLKRALVLWGNSETPKPMRAANHVALQTLRKDLRVREPRSFCWVGWSLIGLAIVSGVTVLVVSL
jgi:hypothetical protein